MSIKSKIIYHLVWHNNNIAVGPKLKFYLFPLTRPTLKKPYSKKIISIFSQEYIFKFHCNLRELFNVNSVILANCLCI